MRKKAVDFLVIGAQKSGTTALFRYMRGHPELYLPAQKEINFFANENRFRNGTDWYIETYFGGADEDRLWGEVSPHYLEFSSAPARIHQAFPHVKLVAILRNPIDRAYSHYRMVVRRGQEDRSFSRVIEDQSRSSEMPETETEDDSEFVLHFSRYGCTLASYLNHFDRDQILVLFQEDLLSDPEEPLRKLFSILGVDCSYVPPNLGKRYHVGGRRRSAGLEQWIENRSTIKRVIKGALGQKAVEAARFWFRQLNVKPVEDEEGPSVGDRLVLKTVFDGDVALLKRLFSLSTPWPEFEVFQERSNA